MHPHHAASIQKIKAHFEQVPNVLALLLTGSIAHGFETEASDVDVLVVLTEEAYQHHVDTGIMTFVTPDLCTYPGGYVDAKYTSLGFIRLVAEKGSEPARWAFDGAQILFSEIPGLEGELQRLVRFDAGGKEERIVRFRSQLEIWKWYSEEGVRKGNRYLLNMATSKLILFGGRLILADNDVLFPYHKWFLRVLGELREKPERLMECVERLSREPGMEVIQEFYDMVVGWKEWKRPRGRFGAQFMVDSELNWLILQTPVDDL
ncbi:hypothetical protein B0H67DRAFT_642692 [Lasiosphaeris hirsuta]|uniref:Polymerase beta nucleotidyltransferase domain-containing protein n=1 Tax=Lasiosphaeris hirsuta TaxID=260670 RepID=A0AA40DWV2_9PEZI|nr:hypothetical protein B0H67DRAFT_642692 [Lasiosphaeris hirsuta]